MSSSRVLVVDDDARFLTFLERTLKRAGFPVQTAKDGSEVSDIVARTNVDLLILDLQMAGMNGWEVLRSLRGPVAALSRKGKPLPKVIVVSGRREDETVAFVRRLGADAYLTKPLLGKQLLATVRRVLADQTPAAAALD